MPALPDLFSPVTKLIIPCCMLRHRLGADQLKAWCVGCLHSDQRRIYMLFEPVVCATIHRCSQPLVNVRNTHSLGSTNRSHLRFLRHRPERSERCLNYEKLYQGQRVTKGQRCAEGLGRTTEGFYDTRPHRSGRRKCHEYHTKGSRFEQKSRVCRCLHRRNILPKQSSVHNQTILQARAALGRVDWVL